MATILTFCASKKRSTRPCKNEEKLKKELKAAKTKAEEIDKKEAALVQEKQELQSKVDAEIKVQ